ASKAGLKKNAALEKLSSGLRINRGADDPSGLIISELLRSRISGYERALRNTQETSNVMSIAEGGLSSVSSMLTKMKSLAVHALNSGITSGAQVSADQMELNSALSTIQRVVSTTNYAGANLLDGARGFTYATQDPGNLIDRTGTSIAGISGTASREVAISFAGGASAQAERAYSEADFGGAVLAEAQEFTILGNDGARSFSFAAGTSVADMADQINQAAGSTGVNAYAIRDDGSGATSIRLASAEYGADAMLRVDQAVGSGFAAAGDAVLRYGRNASVSVNGTDVITNGLTANVATADLNATISFQADAIAQTGYDQDSLINAGQAQSARLTDIRGGMQLQLGEGSGGQERQAISLGNYNPAVLGQVAVDGRTYSLNDLYSGGAASLANNPGLAMRIIDQAIADVSAGRANIGAYQANALETNANNLMVAIENTTATESSIRDTDMAMAITLYIKNKLLEDAGLRGVQNANMNANNVAKLLGGGLGG
ncbi:MAG: flagellin, partial [Planctomycetes bacterium]|nr:flagellin [Planctomycetota bacterium]